MRRRRWIGGRALGIDYGKKKRQFGQGIYYRVGHLFMSGIYNVGYCAMTRCDFRNVSSGEVLFFSTDTARQ